MAAAAMRIAATGFVGAVRAAFMGAGNEFGFVLSAIVLPLQRLEVTQIIRAAVANGHNMIDFPAVAAASIAVILPDNGPTPRVHPEGGVGAHRSGLLPHGFDGLRREGATLRVRVRLSLHFVVDASD